MLYPHLKKDYESARSKVKGEEDDILGNASSVGRKPLEATESRGLYKSRV